MKRTLLCLIVFVLTTQIGFSQSKINRAENSLKKKPEPSSARSYSGSDDDDDSSSDLGFFGEFFADIFIQGFSFLTYQTFIGTPNEFPNSYVTKYPFNNSDKGNYNVGLDENFSRFRTDLSGRYLFENNTLKSMDLSLNLRFLRRFGLDFDYYQLWENNPNFGKDNLAIYDFLAKYYRVRAEKFDLWWGLGTTYVGGEVHQFGFTYGLGMEWFFANPLSIEANFNQSFINTETVNKLNFLLNYHKKNFKLIGGYEHLKIGSQDFSNITVGVGLFLY
ncbi:hypothetical protein [Gaetbulibacter aestuarii]|uniref:Uncharacterized protein n=1 Tax=Gaetbulibacter aestuarii TaxID=1502358 RepID=A0ABW7MWV5_9FLAO